MHSTIKAVNKFRQKVREMCIMKITVYYKFRKYLLIFFLAKLIYANL